MGGGGGGLKALFGAIVFLGVICFLFAGIIANHVTTIRTPSLSRNSKNWNSVAEERHLNHRDSNLHYVSKRRVPNGPDPIHNRRAQRSRQPPGTS